MRDTETPIIDKREAGPDRLAPWEAIRLSLDAAPPPGLSLEFLLDRLKEQR